MTKQKNIKLTIEYDGSGFHGYQFQETLRTVQGEIEKALFSLTQKEHRLVVAGRTDKGVHATAQVCSFVTDSKLQLIAFLDGLNRFLPNDIAIRKVEEVDLEFNARFSARARFYEYNLVNRRMKSAIQNKRVTVYKYPLDLEKMKQAAEFLVGEHDFSSFRAARCQAKSPITELYSIDLEEIEEKEGTVIRAKIHGRSFLHNMIRIIMGTLVEIGRGELEPEFMLEILNAKDRTKAGVTLHPDGLYFTGVDYENNHKVYAMEPR
ncbi:MAG: tRNA pseudouridine(38-40) synthase TruA [Proteobacteria bacterium]|nr:tRNA pseudouridine(38-40) synthase TruA [Pseudomonadota bacterium]